MHAVIGPHDYTFSVKDTYARDSVGYAQALLIDERHGSVHTGLTLNELAPRGEIRTHLHSFEEGFYLLEGAATVTIGTRPIRCDPGDFALVRVGIPHSWYNAGDRSVRWLQMSVPQPKPLGGERDTFFVRSSSAPPIEQWPDDSGRPISDHFDPSQIPQLAARSPAIGQGVFLKWLIDEAFGAVHHRLLFIQYEPGASIALHDHTFEESYFILSGEVDATLDGQTHKVGPGSVLWTGVGCVHAFANGGSAPVQWIETFSPQPPRENVFRFMGEWERRGATVESEGVALPEEARNQPRAAEGAPDGARP